MTCCLMSYWNPPICTKDATHRRAYHRFSDWSWRGMTVQKFLTEPFRLADQGVICDIIQKNECASFSLDPMPTSLIAFHKAQCYPLCSTCRSACNDHAATSSWHQQFHMSISSLFFLSSIPQHVWHGPSKICVAYSSVKPHFCGFQLSFHVWWYCPALAAIGKDSNNVALQDYVPCFYRYVLVFDYFLHLLESILCHAYSYFNFGIVSSIRRDCTPNKVFEFLYLLDGFIDTASITTSPWRVACTLETVSCQPLSLFCVSPQQPVSRSCKNSVSKQTAI